MTKQTFPVDFVWGAATASYQIEGAVAEDGRGPSIWDTFSHTPGNVANGDTGDVACDHYHRWAEDVALLRSLGCQTYRFSIAWPRVFPQGTGLINERGLDFYDRLVDELLAANITPYVTLYHWDLPQALQDQGGWSNRATVDAFVAYTDAVARRLGDRVKHWITHNEPWVVSILGNYEGIHAPGIKDPRTALQVAHHVLLSHGLGAAAIRTIIPDAQVGITLNLTVAQPASDSAEDQGAAERFDGFHNRWFLDPLFGRGYPADMIALYAPFLPPISPDDLNAIAAPLDFLGINYYAPTIARAVPFEQSPLGFQSLTPEELAARGYELTEMGWPVDPQSFTNLLTRVQRDYNPQAIYITENGCAYDDQLVNGAVHDPQRVTYLRGHLQAVHAAIEAGAPVRGYFVWSMMDNFEWALGYSKRFGIVYVDYTTLQRIPKASAEFYQKVIAANGVG